MRGYLIATVLPLLLAGQIDPQISASRNVYGRSGADLDIFCTECDYPDFEGVPGIYVYIREGGSIPYC
jgi:hypothetical protein